ILPPFCFALREVLEPRQAFENEGHSMRRSTLAALAAALLLSASAVFAASNTATAPETAAASPQMTASQPAGAKPAPAPVQPVTETFWGKKVTDNYRYMEKLEP